jgi:hypothetical protein
MNAGSKFSISPDVLTQEVGDEIVILDLANGVYLGLDPVGARIWRLVGEGKSFAEICETLFEEFDASRAELEGDVTRLVGDLAGRRLIHLNAG